MTVLTAI